MNYRYKKAKLTVTAIGLIKTGNLPLVFIDVNVVVVERIVVDEFGNTVWAMYFLGATQALLVGFAGSVNVIHGGAAVC